MPIAAHADYKHFFRRLKAVAEQENRLYPFLILDTGRCALRYGMALTDELNFKLYKRTAAEHREYFGAMREEKLYDQVSPPARTASRVSAAFWTGIRCLCPSPMTAPAAPV